MTEYLEDILPMPITYLQRHITAKMLWEIAAPNKHFPGLNKHIDIPYDGSFETLSLQSNKNSFYKSLSWVIFATEDFEHLVRFAIMTHAKTNTFALREMYLAERSFHDKEDNVYEYLRTVFKKNHGGASAIELYTAAHLLQIPIYVFNKDNIEDITEYSPKRINKDIDFDSLYGILLCAEPDGGHKTFIFRPVTSYRRSNELSDVFEEHSLCSDDSADEDSNGISEEDVSKSVVLLSNSGKSSISIPYITVKIFSESLAEFCGMALDTDVSAECLYQLKTYMTKSAHNTCLTLDAELYEFARKWNITSIVNEIDTIVLHSKLSDVVAFANEVTLFENMSLYDHLEQLIYQSSLDSLKNVHVHTKSECHKNLSNYIAKLIISREYSLPLVSWYNEPHVLVCLDEKAKCFGQYFNGERWCTIYIPEKVKEILPYIEDNKFCVINDKLFFIKDECTIGEIQLLNCYNCEITYTKLNECVTNPRIATSTDPETMLLLSNETDRKISEVKVLAGTPTYASPWRSINTENFKFKFLEKNCILYTIEDHQLALKTDSADGVEGVITIAKNDLSEVTVYHYDISSNKVYQNQHKQSGFKHILVPGQTNNSSKFLVIPTHVLSAHISKFHEKKLY